MMQRLPSLLERAGLCLGLASILSGSALGSQAEPAPPQAPSAPPSATDEGAPVEVVMLRLHGGSLLWASIEDHGPQALVVRRLDNGGVVNLPWTFLEPDQSHELRLRFGYVDIEGEEPMTDGHRLLLIDGTELVGRIQSTTPDTLVLKQEGGALLVPVTRVKEARPAQVAALEVFTKDELYATRLGELESNASEPTPLEHYELARFCERILAFPQALEHYRKAQELDPAFKPSELAATLARVEAKVVLQVQLDVLAEADRRKRKGYYQDALEVLARFDATYPDTPLRSDRLKLEDRIVKERGRALKQLVREQWYSWMDRLAGDAAREYGFEAAIQWVDDSLGEGIAKKVTEDARRIWPEIEEDQVRQFWRERDPGRWRAASYGLGTWLLGPDDALKGGAEEEKAAKEAPKTERDKQREDIEEKMERFLKNQQMARAANRSDEDEQQVEDFWSTLSVATRKAWLVAYYAENSGEVELRPRPELSPCPSCGGRGALEVVYTGSARSNSAAAGMRLEECPTCHGIGAIRRVRYR